MSDPAYVKAFKAYTRDDPTFTDLPAMEREFYGESARAVVILQASMVEAILEKAIEQQMRRDLTVEMKKDIFEFEGPVGSFSAKALMAFALDIIGPKTKRDLDLIRLMRNQFAHCRKPLRFDMPEVAGVCEHLSLPDVPDVSLTPMALLRISGGKKVDLKNPKTRYVTCCHSIPSLLLEFIADRETGSRLMKSSALP